MMVSDGLLFLRDRRELAHPDRLARPVDGSVDRPPLVVAQTQRSRDYLMGFDHERLLGWPLELLFLLA